ncbi:hypothetical protein [Thioalkalivibrio sp. HK1]|uniref:hypothetical protein n=1 Tax=Thioalkalivibrio sp. HK1 TaxID=1469245 RepID=UPI00046EDE1A|nr:hypothetical protein [Thioalkalivibrio sp. HK1]
MHISLSELKEATVRAASSVGLPPGLADEAGILASRILRSSIEGDRVLGRIEDLVEALEALDRKDSFRFAKTPAIAGHFIAQRAKAPLSCLWCGPSLGDRLIVAAAEEGRQSGSIACVEAVDIPSPIVHHLLWASQAIEGLVRIVCRSRTALASPAMPEIELTCHRGRLLGSKIPLRGPAWMSIALDPSPSPDTAGEMIEKRSMSAYGRANEGMGGEIEKALWQRLCVLAEKQLVENSERSRLTGAGAGVVDRD